tara:strand:+ start:2474 stop:3952 length:1479 start_codon:yes stop_codon:yes gene_type:complete
MAKDAPELTNDLTVAINRLNRAKDGLIFRFGQAGESGNKLWNVISRFSSGSTFWRLQNYLRGVSNVVNFFTKAQEENRTQILESLESNLALADSLKMLKERYDKIEAGGTTPYYELLLGDLGDAKLAKEEAKGFYKKYIDEIENVVKKRGAQLRKSILNRGKGITKRFAEANPFEFQKPTLEGGTKNAPIRGSIGFILKETFAPLTNILTKTFEFTKGPFLDSIKGPERIVRKKLFGLSKLQEFENKGRIGYRKKMTQNLQVMGKWFKGAGKALGEFSVKAAALIGKFAMYGLLIVFGITLIAKIINAGWPVIRKQFEDAFGFFKKAFLNVLGILLGVFNLIGKIFAGDIVGAIKVFFKEIVFNLVKLLGNLLAGLFKIMLGIITGILAGIYNATFGALTGRKIGKHSTGGVSRGGLAVVGENGPELVSLPRGARVQNNANSMGARAGGNNIHIHINGRVGASDAEIRDIANKVAREINIRMNRTGANRIGA